MSDHTVVFTTTASTSVTVTEEEVQAQLELGAADRRDAVEQAAWDKFHNPYVCAQCAGFGSEENGIELSGEWDVPEDGVYE